MSRARVGNYHVFVNEFETLALPVFDSRSVIMFTRDDHGSTRCSRRSGIVFFIFLLARMYRIFQGFFHPFFSLVFYELYFVQGRTSSTARSIVRFRQNFEHFSIR